MNVPPGSRPLLYDFPVSFHAQIARLAMVERGVDWETRTVDLGPRLENFEPWFCRLNPAMTVPVLEHGGHRLADTLAICRYVDETFPGERLLPVDAAAREPVEEWSELKREFPDRDLTYGLLKGLPGRLARQGLARRRTRLEQHREANPELANHYAAKILDLDEFERTVNDPVAVQAHLERTRALLDRLESRIAEGPWITGSRYSLADVVWTAILARLELVGLGGELRDRPAVARYWQRLKSRPSFRAARMHTRTPAGLVIPILVRALWVPLLMGALIILALVWVLAS
jgi:tetrachloro-p-hydroquinone reductive dehalogenase